MFFFFSKILTILFFPLPLTILLGIILTFFVVKKYKILFVSPFLMLWFFSSYPVCQLLIGSLEKDYPPVSIEEIDKSDAIVVLAGMINNFSVYENRIELMEATDRLTDAMFLYQAKKADLILITGGSGILFYQSNPEAELAKKFLIKAGIPDNQIIAENESRNTAENAIYTAKILKKLDKKSIILVTSAFHLKRSLATFSKQGIQTKPFPTDYRTLKSDWNWDVFVPSVGALSTSTIAIKEWIGIFAYKWKGYSE
ncbi:MAG: YdcF family protein [Leptospiraceae bacterium]|nr:YdcF family protein [Leptospiraceae bacterium]MCP5495122.1 YdcF family protein [Leptospiraceae bacterium]